VIVRWGLGELPAVLGELAVERPLLVTTGRWSGIEVPVASRYEGALPHAGRAGVDGAARAAREARADCLVALGGGAAIDTAKAVSARTGLPVVSVPTTYSGAEWTDFFGVRDEEKQVKVSGAGAHLAGIVYEVELTLGLPRRESGGSALNALAHCAEALYVTGRNMAADAEALEGARLISASLPSVLEQPEGREARRLLLEGAMHGGAAMAGAGLGLGHAMAQALGGRFGVSHGAANALCLPPAIRFSEPAAPEAVRAFGEAVGASDGAPGRVEELAGLAGYTRLRELGIPAEELGEAASAAAERAGAKANLRRASAVEIAELYRSVW
jgi:alcohol dehydrogenase class IV